MDRYDRDLLDYVRSWTPYGGPPSDEVLAEFGLTPSQLVDRVNLIITTEKARREEELQQPWLRVQSAGGATRRSARTTGE
ncbi:MAG: hypothetical protein HYZ38_14225 [Mycobacterium sp.]|nr:hypothetical protein [Mycobacterium sp.]